MLWITSQTRPDMAFQTCVMSNPGKKPTVQALTDANKAVKSLKANDSFMLKYDNLGNPIELSVAVYSDATHGSLPDDSFQGGYVAFVQVDQKVAPLLWQSKKLKRVTISPLASEAMELCEAADAGVFLAIMVKKIYHLEE